MVWVKMKSLSRRSSKRIRRTTILKKLPSSKNRSKRRLSLNSQKSPKNKLKASKNHKKIKITKDKEHKKTSARLLGLCPPGFFAY